MGGFRSANTLLLILGSCGSLAPLLWGGPFEYTEDFSKFGRQPNVTFDGVCAAASLVNSLAYLENMYPGTYGGSLLPNLMANGTDPIDIAALATGGWNEPPYAHSDDTPTPDLDVGYYSTLRPAGDPIGNYLNVKTDWFSDHAPPGDLTAFAVYNNPTIAQLANEMLHQEDVEFFVSNDSQTFVHAVTLTAIKCDDSGNCFIRYQDPNNPGVNQDYTHVLPTGPGGQLRFAFNDPRAGIVSIYAAFSESPVPEPSFLIPLVSALTAIVAAKSARRRA